MITPGIRTYSSVTTKPPFVVFWQILNRPETRLQLRLPVQAYLQVSMNLTKSFRSVGVCPCLSRSRSAAASRFSTARLMTPVAMLIAILIDPCSTYNTGRMESTWPWMNSFLNERISFIRQMMTFVASHITAISESAITSCGSRML